MNVFLRLYVFYYVACYFTMIYRIHLTNLPHDLSVCKCHVSVCVCDCECVCSGCVTGPHGRAVFVLNGFYPV